MKAYREGKKYFVYMDETWIFQKGSNLTYVYEDDNIRSCASRHASSGGRFIVIHAGGRKGFVPGAGKVWSSSAKPQPGDDYHSDMDGRIMVVYVRDDLLPGLPEPCIIVLDNASYHIAQAFIKSVLHS